MIFPTPENQIKWKKTIIRVRVNLTCAISATREFCYALHKLVDSLTREGRSVSFLTRLTRSRLNRIKCGNSCEILNENVQGTIKIRFNQADVGS